jgi:hypothetical protein
MCLPVSSIGPWNRSVAPGSTEAIDEHPDMQVIFRTSIAWAWVAGDGASVTPPLPASAADGAIKTTPATASGTAPRPHRVRVRRTVRGRLTWEDPTDRIRGVRAIPVGAGPQRGPNPIGERGGRKARRGGGTRLAL